MGKKKRNGKRVSGDPRISKKRDLSYKGKEMVDLSYRGKEKSINRNEYPSSWDSLDMGIVECIKEGAALKMGTIDGLDYYLNHDGRMRVFKKGTKIPSHKVNEEFVSSIQFHWDIINSFLIEKNNPKWKNHSPDSIFMYLQYKKYFGEEMEIDVSEEVYDLGYGPCAAVSLRKKVS